MPGAEDLAVAELSREDVRPEVALVDAPARAIVEDSLLVLVVDVRALARSFDDHELARDTAAFGDESRTVGAFEMSVEEAREEAVEACVGKRQVERVSLREARVRRLALRLVEHLGRLVEA